MRHPDQRQILEFLGGRASESDAEALYAHLDSCGACAERVATLRELAADFDGAWEDFLEEARFRAEAKAQAAGAPARWELVVSGLLDGARRLSTLAAAGVSGAVRSICPEPVLVPAYAGAGSPGWAGVADLALAASTHCRAGRPAEALAALDEIGRRFPAAAASGMMELRAPEGILGRVVVDSHRRVVAVMVDRARLPHVEGWAEMETEDATRRVPLEPVEGARYLLAEFEQVPSAPFRLRLGLVAGGDSPLRVPRPPQGGDPPS